MPASEYSAAPGGSLKFKGSAGIDKKKKKKKPKLSDPTALNTSASASPVPNHTSDSLSKSNSTQPADKNIGTPINDEFVKDVGAARHKTEAERKHEERRKRRLDERLKREGIKTHKERVEELNKYLSGLSEHHDMPKIGPG
ncbi:DUF1754-domain-containing protein [Delitschia confertaspora ATCC 74209]|uniref:DUF1754-domain-containing protein n=1 Tax=Delitschia confertaspora ATCC 74209 TaxID=1513339 RepID=A0A9P4JPK8_9PLEO|nr:DUF1754-domain-containing protein [Delitschia confertaspora ATCC 74209]